jgi:tetratricopeptide (TPR) repeat protein
LTILGRKKIQSKEYTEAIKLFTQVIDHHDGKNIKAIFYRALSYLDQGNLQQAINEFWRVVSLYSELKSIHDEQAQPSISSSNSREKEAQLCQ